MQDHIHPFIIDGFLELIGTPQISLVWLKTLWTIAILERY